MNRTRAIAAVGAMLLAGVMGAGVARAQRPGGGPPPEMAARRQQWEKWRASHKNLSELQGMTGRVRGLDRDPSTRLTKAQAAKLLGILKQWQAKPAMSEVQAKQVDQQISGLLNAGQRKRLAQLAAERRPGGFGGGPGGPGGFGRGRPDGLGMRPGGGPPAGGPPGGGPGGGPPGGRRGAGPGGPGGFGRGPGGPGGFRMPGPPSGAYNPLNPDTLPFAPMRARAKQRQSEFMAALAQRAAGK